MAIYILDTDHLSLYGRNHPIVVARLQAIQVQLTTTAINVEEQLRGRLAQIAEARDGATLSSAYQRLVETVMMLSEFDVLQYDTKSREIYQELKGQRIRVGTQDLRIASITLAYKGILLTRNLQDFEKVPGLSIQDWSILG
ncbi:type II toxin-antitoxin system VapC family toxin [Tolypothrix campylonemoides VB511288]|nr:type II toxin-antitoxin system VapC family toxin [Tolypothrix campylonemoides VB511288]